MDEPNYAYRWACVRFNHVNCQIQSSGMLKSDVYKQYTVHQIYSSLKFVDTWSIKKRPRLLWFENVNKSRIVYIYIIK